MIETQNISLRNVRYQTVEDSVNLQIYRSANGAAWNDVALLFRRMSILLVVVSLLVTVLWNTNYAEQRF